MAASSETYWCCGQAGIVAVTGHGVRACTCWWCDACDVGWGTRDQAVILAANRARRDYLIGAGVLNPSSAFLLTGV